MPVVTYYGMGGQGEMIGSDGLSEPIADVQMFFHSNELVSGSYVCGGTDRILDAWLFDHGMIRDGILLFDMVKVALRFSRQPRATFIGRFDGEGTFAGDWISKWDRGTWYIKLNELLSETRENPDADYNRIHVVAQMWAERKDLAGLL